MSRQEGFKKALEKKCLHDSGRKEEGHADDNENGDHDPYAVDYLLCPVME